MMMTLPDTNRVNNDTDRKRTVNRRGTQLMTVTTVTITVVQRIHTTKEAVHSRGAAETITGERATTGAACKADRQVTLIIEHVTIVVFRGT